jgi:hypothetical protein
MQEHSPPALGKNVPSRPLYAPPAEFTLAEKRRIFKGMVVSELEAGFLRYSRREALLKYAEKLKIPEFEACLLIAEAQFHAGDLDPVQFETEATLDAITRPEAWSIPLRLAIALAAAVVIDLAMICWLFA